MPDAGILSVAVEVLRVTAKEAVEFQAKINAAKLLAAAFEAEFYRVTGRPMNPPTKEGK